MRRTRSHASRNALPGGTWLSSVRFESSTIALDGRARRVDAVAAALETLSSLHDARGARLLSARTEQAGDAVAYAIAVDRVR